jgi:hypothetical protein
MKRTMHRGGRQGQSLVEFALIIPLLFLLFVNVVNFGAFFFAWITVANAARAGAQYGVMGTAGVGAPLPPGAAEIYTLVQSDITSLRNRANLVVRSCQEKIVSGSPVVTCTTTGSGSFTNPVADDSAEGVSTWYVRSWVDVKCNYVPLIPLYRFPGLGIYLTLPPTTLHRQAVMRMIQ